MDIIKSENTVRKIKNGLSYFAKVYLTLRLTEKNILEIEEQYQEQASSGFSQGQSESISSEGYSNWKQGIHNGIAYAYGKLTENCGLKVIIENATGLVTDTNPTIIGFSTSRAILDKLPNDESQSELELLEKMMYSSWNYEHGAIPDFVNKKIVGEKLTT
ncbi:hypothetical protein MHTCC0001_32560 [Flavobacteriaceae bacterium MHTCC 0001]